MTCRDCDGRDGRHGMVHVQPAGRWRICPQALVAAALSLHVCTACEQCGAVVACECAQSGDHCRRDWPCATVRELDRIDRELGIETGEELGVDNQSEDETCCDCGRRWTADPLPSCCREHQSGDPS